MTEAKEKRGSPAKRAFAEYKAAQEAEKAKMKAVSGFWPRFWARLAFLLRWPFKWLWMACHDWRLILIFVGWMALIGCEVWVPLVMAWLVPPLRVSMLAVAGACEAFWLLPFTPFIPLCIALTVGTKAVMDRIAAGKKIKAKK